MFFLCSPQPINRGVPLVLFQRGSIIFQGVQLFPGMGGGGVQMLKQKKNVKAVFLPSGLDPPPPPDKNSLIRTCYVYFDWPKS